MAHTTKHGRSTWATKLDDSTITTDVSWWYETATGKGQVDVDVIAGDSSWIEKRKGELTIERTAISGKIMYAVVESLFGDVKPQDRTVKGAAEQYGSMVAQLVVEQRRRAALVQGASKLSNGTAKTVTLDVDLWTNVRNALTIARAKYPSNSNYAAAMKALDEQLQAAGARMPERV